MKAIDLVKIITGRRCGKSVLLFNLFHDYLISEGVPDENIIRIRLDERTNMPYRNPNLLCGCIRDWHYSSKTLPAPIGRLLCDSFARRVVPACTTNKFTYLFEFLRRHRDYFCPN